MEHNDYLNLQRCRAYRVKLNEKEKNFIDGLRKDSHLTDPMASWLKGIRDKLLTPPELESLRFNISQARLELQVAPRGSKMWAKSKSGLDLLERQLRYCLTK